MPKGDEAAVALGRQWQVADWPLRQGSGALRRRRINDGGFLDARGATKTEGGAAA